MTIYNAEAYEFTGVEDSYKKGELPETEKMYEYESKYSSKYLLDIIDRIKAEFEIKSDNQLSVIDYSGDDTLLQVNWYEDEKGTIISQETDPIIYEDWKKGKVKLYSCRIIYVVTKQEIISVPIEELEKLGIKKQ